MKDLYFQENHRFKVGNVVFQEDNMLDEDNTRWKLASINNYGKILGIVDAVENKTCFSVTKDRFSKYTGLLPGSVYYLCDRKGIAVINPILPPDKFKIPVFVAANERVAILWDVAMSGPGGPALKGKLLSAKKNDIVAMSTPMSEKSWDWKDFWTTPPTNNTETAEIAFGINIKVKDSDGNGIPGARVWVGVPSSETRTQGFVVSEGIADESGSYYEPFSVPIEEFLDEVIVRVRLADFKPFQTTGAANYDKNAGGLFVVATMQTDTFFFEPDSKNENALAKLGKDLLKGPGGFSALGSKEPPEKSKVGDMWLNTETLETSVFDGTDWLSTSSLEEPTEPTENVQVEGVTDFVKDFAKNVGLDPNKIKVFLKAPLATSIEILYDRKNKGFLKQQVRRVNKEIINLLKLYKIFDEEERFKDICEGMLIEESRKADYFRGRRCKYDFNVITMSVTISLGDSAVGILELGDVRRCAEEAMSRLFTQIRGRRSNNRRWRDSYDNNSTIKTMGVDPIIDRDDDVEAMFANEMMNMPSESASKDVEQDLEDLIKALDGKPELKSKLQKVLKKKQEGRTAENELGNRPLDLD